MSKISTIAEYVGRSERADKGYRSDRSPLMGHNIGRRSMYAVIFDFDTDMLKQLYPNSSWQNAYTDVRNYLTSRGFEWVQGSGYFGNESIDAVRCVRIVQRMAKKYPWFTGSIRDIRMLRIEENNDLMGALTDQDDD